MKNTARLLLTGLLFAVLVLAGCQTDTVEEPMDDTGMSTDDVEDVEPEYEMVDATLDDESLTLDRASVPAGEVEFTVSNEGELYNEFAVEGNGEYHEIEGGVMAGESAAIIVELSQGTYKVYSPIPGREDRGVVASLSVE